MSYEKKTLLYSVRRALSLHALLTVYVQYIVRMLMVGGLLFSELDSASF